MIVKKLARLKMREVQRSGSVAPPGIEPGSTV